MYTCVYSVLTCVLHVSHLFFYFYLLLSIMSQKQYCCRCCHSRCVLHSSLVYKHTSLITACVFFFQQLVKSSLFSDNEKTSNDASPPVGDIDLDDIKSSTSFDQSLGTRLDGGINVELKDEELPKVYKYNTRWMTTRPLNYYILDHCYYVSVFSIYALFFSACWTMGGPIHHLRTYLYALFICFLNLISGWSWES